MDDSAKLRPLRPLPSLIFASRWLQTGIHITFLLSAMAIAASDRLMPHPEKPAKADGLPSGLA